MAHRSAGAGNDEHGIGGLTPPTGPLTSFMLIGGFIAFVWLIVKHPRCAAAALGCAAVTAIFALDNTGVEHSFTLMLLTVVLGALCAEAKPRKPRKRRHEPAPAPVPTRTTVTKPLVTETTILAHARAMLERNES